MAYDNESAIFKAPIPAAGNQSSSSEESARTYAWEWPLSTLLEIIIGPDLDCTLYAGGFLVSAGSGLSVDVAAGAGMIAGLVIYAGDVTNKAGLPDDTATIYIYLKQTAATKRDRSLTVEWSLSGPPMADAILIATCTSSGGSVTSMDNDPIDRAPRFPAE